MTIQLTNSTKSKLQLGDFQSQLCPESPWPCPKCHRPVPLSAAAAAAATAPESQRPAGGSAHAAPCPMAWGIRGDVQRLWAGRRLIILVCVCVCVCICVLYTYICIYIYIYIIMRIQRYLSGILGVFKDERLKGYLQKTSLDILESLTDFTYLHMIEFDRVSTWFKTCGFSVIRGAES